ncbi:family regulatory [Pyrenophora seminiperda CCB06]|uniref:Family regulatory n=1 Tax=Pyrenophora seminiperda CCB06 TaxID=1302712 RepID=A0A3M7M805_9PLEO|nr:family regulatory [Pyrenophora seminiperda CCB06]
MTHDDTPANRVKSIEYTMLFPSVLSAPLLASSLSTLLSKPGWRKLGARLRLNASTGRLEYHIPTSYTASYPPINFTQKSYDMNLADHPIGRQFPTVDKDSEHVQVFDNLNSLRSLTQTQGSTVVMEDWIGTDKAQLGLHVVNFKDKTLVTLCWLHTLLDAMGRRALLEAWTAVLSGREGDVKDFWGWEEDPLEKLGMVEEGNEEREKVARKEQQVNGWLAWIPNFKPAFNYFYSWLFATDDKTQSGRMIYMPAAYLTRLRTRALHDLDSLHPSQITFNTASSPPKPFVSDGDILCAWLTQQLVSSSLARLNNSRSLTLINVLGLRDVLSKASGAYDVLLPKDKAYIGNATMGISSKFSIQDFLGMPLGHVAARIRKSLIEQGSREAVEKAHRDMKLSKERVAPKEKNQVQPAVFVCTNWAKAGLFEIDFGGAVVSGGNDDAESMDRADRGKPEYIHVYGTDTRGTGTGSEIEGISCVVGRERKGGYWLAGILAKEFAANFEKHVLGA